MERSGQLTDEEGLRETRMRDLSLQVVTIGGRLAVITRHTYMSGGRVSNWAEGLWLDSDLKTVDHFSGYPGVGFMADIEFMDGYAVFVEHRRGWRHDLSVGIIAPEDL